MSSAPVSQSSVSVATGARYTPARTLRRPPAQPHWPAMLSQISLSASSGLLSSGMTMPHWYSGSSTGPSGLSTTKVLLTSHALAAALKLASLSSAETQLPPLANKLQSRAMMAGFWLQAVLVVRGSYTRAPRITALMLGTPAGKTSWSYCRVTSRQATPSKRSDACTTPPTSACRSAYRFWPGAPV